MAYKNYIVNDKWLDLNKQNIIELQSEDGELVSAKCNGEDIGSGGGGGSSDLSTAEVTLNLTPPEGVTLIDEYIMSPVIVIDENPYTGQSITVTDHKANIPLVNNEARFMTAGGEDSNGDIYAIDTVTEMSSNITYDSDLGEYVVTGDGSITATLVLY